MNENINLIEIVEAEWKRNEEVEKQEHIHLEGKRGASNLNGCNFITSIKEAGIKKLPIKTGIRAHKGGLTTGKWLHAKLEDTLENYFLKHAGQYPTLIPVKEVYTLTPLVHTLDPKIIESLHDVGRPIKEFLAGTMDVISSSILDFGITEDQISGLNNPLLKNFTINIPRTFEDVLLYHPDWLGVDIIESPIDFALLTKPGWVFKPIQFKNVTLYKRFKHPLAQWSRIWDFKSAGNYGYWKSKAIPINDGHRAQFHGYMKGRLTEITMLDIHKAKAFLFEKKCKYDEGIWSNVVDKHNRMTELKSYFDRFQGYDEIQSAEVLPIVFDDFSCICTKDGFGWYGCELAETYEVLEGDYEEPKLKLKKLCPPAERHMLELLKKKLIIGSEWNRYYGKGKVSITKIDEEGVCARSARGKIYVDTLFYAYRGYSKIVKKTV